MVINTVSKTFTRVFGSRNDRIIKGYVKRVQQINALEPEVCRLSDSELRAKTEEFTQRIERGESMRVILPEVMAVAREAMDRAVGIRNILNPEYQFDPSRLPDDARQLYDQVKQQADALEPVPVRGGDGAEGVAGNAPGWMQVDIPLRLYEAVRGFDPAK